MHSVTKVFHFCYGHRLLNDPCKCKYIHGHNANVELAFSSQELDAQGMVLHFNRIKDTIGKWIDDELDHTLLLCMDDPLVKILNSHQERFKSMDANPTAENIAIMILKKCQDMNLPIAHVRLWETDSSSAIITVSK